MVLTIYSINKFEKAHFFRLIFRSNFSRVIKATADYRKFAVYTMKEQN